MALRPAIRDLVLLFARQAAREFLAEEATTEDAETKKPRDLSGDGAKDFRNADSNPIP
jgi:hypothetical protein